MSTPQAQARQRALLILQVQSGQITATEAARQLGLSRKSYYQWEHRALQALLDSLEQRPPGRPNRATDPEKEQLRQQVTQLQTQVTELEQLLELRRIVQQLQTSDAKKNSRSWKPSSSKPPSPSPPPG
jgi:transposase